MVELVRALPAVGTGVPFLNRPDARVAAIAASEASHAISCRAWASTCRLVAAVVSVNSGVSEPPDVGGHGPVVGGRGANGDGGARSISASVTGEAGRGGGVGGVNDWHGIGHKTKVV
jgi:hypothetical protein